MTFHIMNPTDNKNIKRYVHFQENNKKVLYIKQFFENECFPKLQREGYMLDIYPASAFKNATTNLRICCRFIVKQALSKTVDHYSIGAFIVQEFVPSPGMGNLVGTWHDIKKFVFEKPNIVGNWTDYNKAHDELNTFIRQCIKNEKIASLRAECEKGLL